MDGVLGRQLRRHQLALDRLQSNLGIELGPVALLCHLAHEISSLAEAGLAYHSVRNNRVTLDLRATRASRSRIASCSNPFSITGAQNRRRLGRFVYNATMCLLRRSGPVTNVVQSITT